VVAVETVQSAEEKKRFVRDKFAAISSNYDFLNSTEGISGWCYPGSLRRDASPVTRIDPAGT
jgi:hypothetical protein